jgi:rhodanese-related sulfurtransferase
MAKQHSPRFLQLVNDARSRIRECTVQDVKARIDAHEQFHLVDVREDNEFAKGHVPGAQHLGKGIIERDIEKLIPDQNAEIVLYCGGGFRSALAAVALQKMGYQGVVSMDGGWSGWKEAGYPIEQPAS